MSAVKKRVQAGQGCRRSCRSKTVGVLHKTVQVGFPCSIYAAFYRFLVSNGCHAGLRMRPLNESGRSVMTSLLLLGLSLLHAAASANQIIPFHDAMTLTDQ